MAAAADTNPGNPSLLRDVISHQLGPMPRLLDGLAYGCAAAIPPSPSLSGVVADGNNSGSNNNSNNNVGGNNGIMSVMHNNKRPKEEGPDDDNRPGKKAAHGNDRFGGSGGNSSGLGALLGNSSSVAAPSSGAATTTAASAATATTTGMAMVSENGRGASLSPAVAASPASNLLARPVAADFRHGGGEELMALLKAKVGRLFSLDAEYTHVRRGVSESNGTPTARGAEGKSEAAASDGAGAGVSGVRRVLARLKAVRAGQFVVNVKFDVAGKKECRPCDVAVLSWSEVAESESSSAAAVKTEAHKANFMDVMDGSKPWRTSQHTAFLRVSGHAFQVQY